MLDAIAGPDTGAPYWAPPQARSFLEEVGVAPGRLRIAFSSAPLLGHAVHGECQAALGDAVRLLESLGHELVEAAPTVDRDGFNRAFLTVVCGEVHADLAQAKQAFGRVATPDNVEYTTWALHLLGGQHTAGDFVFAERYLRTAARGVGEFFTRFDAFLTPTVARPPFVIGALQPPAHEQALLRVLGRLRAGSVLRLLGMLEQAAGQVFDFIPYAPLFNVTGQPAMSLPLYWKPENLPVGVQVVGGFGDEATLFRLAGQVESAPPRQDRHPPIFA
jgi:amidase